MTRYEELQRLTSLYGQETAKFYRRVQELGPKIVTMYEEYLGGPKGTEVVLLFRTVLRLS